MRRLLLLGLAALLGVVAFVQVGPPDPAAPDFGTVDVVDPDGATASPSAWYCPWVTAGDVQDTDIMVATQPDVTIDATLLHPIANEEPGTGSFEVIGPGATVISTGSILRLGESPAVVEISNGPAAAAAIQYSDAFITGDRCVVSVPKVWYLTGGSTREGTITELFLFNPFADNATVTVTAYSEFDLDLIQELQNYDVAGRSWASIDLSPFVDFRDNLVMTVESLSGLVIPSLTRIDDRGEAAWPGTAPSETWDFPIVTAGELEPFISVMSAGDDEIIVDVDIITPSGSVRNARQVTVDASIPELIPLSDLAAPPYGVRLRATAPIAASVIAIAPEEDPTGGEGSLETTTTTEAGTDPGNNGVIIKGLAGTVGTSSASSQWIVPVATLLGAETSLFIMNTGTETAVVEWEALGESEYVAGGTVEVAADTVAEVPVEVGVGVYGVSVESDRPISVGWSISGEEGVALVAGIALR